MRRRHLLFILLAWLLSASAGAQTLLLIPGFQEQGMDWRFRQVSEGLKAAGWQDGGNLHWTPQGVTNTSGVYAAGGNVFYTLDLPTRTPIAIQARILDQYLHVVYNQRREPLALAGHSAGGLVARFWLVTNAGIPVHTLVSIATPHLGTPMADITELLADTPLLDMAKSMGFGQLPDSDALYAELREEKPGRFLYWLNHQKHPAIRYVSVVRNSERPDQMDFVVPPHSQNMNNVFALHGHSEVWNTDSGHFLDAADGQRLAQILAAHP